MISNYLEFIAALRQRITVELGMSYATADALAGWADGLASKVLGPEPGKRRDRNGRRPTARALGPMAFDVLLGVACVRLQLVPDEQALERLQRNRDFVQRKRPMRNSVKHTYIVLRKTYEQMRQMGIASAATRKQRLSPARRRAIAKKAAIARWAAIRAADTLRAAAQPAPVPARPQHSAGTGEPSRPGRPRSPGRQE